MKVRHLSQLNTSIDESISWRMHELLNLKSFFNGKKEHLPALLKGAFLLTYGHWEGGVKEIALRYLNHVEQQKKLRVDLTSNFLALESMSAIKQAAASSQILLYQQAVEHVRYNLHSSFKLPNINLVDTESNLNSRVLQNILQCIGLGLEWKHFETKQFFIDNLLLKTRNEIAHNGTALDRSAPDVVNAVTEVLELLRIFRNVVENAAATQSYISPTPQPVPQASAALFA